MARFELESGEQSITVLRGTGSNFYCTCYASKTRFLGLNIIHSSAGEVGPWWYPLSYLQQDDNSLRTNILNQETFKTRIQLKERSAMLYYIYAHVSTYSNSHKPFNYYLIISIHAGDVWADWGNFLPATRFQHQREQRGRGARSLARERRSTRLLVVRRLTRHQHSGHPEEQWRHQTENSLPRNDDPGGTRVHVLGYCTVAIKIARWSDYIGMHYSLV